MSKTAEETQVLPESMSIGGDAADTNPSAGGATDVGATGNAAEGSLQGDLDRLSLQRALLDFDLANARVIDLTHRYVEATEEIKHLRHDLEALRIEYSKALADLEQMRGTRAFRTAERIWAVRRALNV